MQKLVYLTALIAVSVWAQIDVSRLSADALKADVSFLASDALRGRGTPSPGLEIAGEFMHRSSGGRGSSRWATTGTSKRLRSRV